jgi:hypothetical protein
VSVEAVVLFIDCSQECCSHWRMWTLLCLSPTAL